jgi:predicted DNA-binding transcriptional regulator AlpA
MKNRLPPRIASAGRRLTVVTKPKKSGGFHIDRRAGRLLEDHVSEGPDDELLSTDETAQWLEVSTQWLEIMRGRSGGPRFVRISPRIVKYRRADVRLWLRQRSHASTKEYQR